MADNPELDETMAYTVIQKLRKARATNKGANKRLAATLRSLADMLGRKGPEEFSRTEIRELQKLRETLTLRLYMNAQTKAMQRVVNGDCRIVNGKYRIELNQKDL